MSDDSTPESPPRRAAPALTTVSLLLGPASPRRKADESALPFPGHPVQGSRTAARGHPHRFAGEPSRAQAIAADDPDQAKALAKELGYLALVNAATVGNAPSTMRNVQDVRSWPVREPQPEPVNGFETPAAGIY